MRYTRINEASICGEPGTTQLHSHPGDGTGGNNACAPAVRRDSSHGEKPSQQRQQAVADICNDVRDNMRSERPKRDGSKSRDPSSSFAYLDPGIGVVEMQIRFTMCGKETLFMQTRFPMCGTETSSYLKWCFALICKFFEFAIKRLTNRP